VPESAATKNISSVTAGLSAAIIEARPGLHIGAGGRPI